MQASPGDFLMVAGHRAGDTVRRGEILEVHGSDGAPPYEVRWVDNGQQALVFPGPDSTVEHRTAAESPS